MNNEYEFIGSAIGNIFYRNTQKMFAIQSDMQKSAENYSQYKEEIKAKLVDSESSFEKHRLEIKSIKQQMLLAFLTFVLMIAICINAEDFQNDLTLIVSKFSLAFGLIATTSICISMAILGILIDSKMNEFMLNMAYGDDSLPQKPKPIEKFIYTQKLRLKHLDKIYVDYVDRKNIELEEIRNEQELLIKTEQRRKLVEKSLKSKR